jgi:hypothetical protein
VDEIAAERRLARSTIEGHLSHFIGLGELDIYSVLDRETVADIQQFLQAQPEAAAAEAKSHFGEKYSYGELKMVIRHVQKHKLPSRRLLEENETDYVNFKGRTWKKLLTGAIEDLMQATFDNRLAFFWDEVPYMLEGIRKHDGPQLAAEVIDTVRSLRMEHDKFRVIFTGSIGLHHVLGRLSAAGIPTSAKNDMYHVTVTPLAPGDAEKLAADLVQGEGIACDDLADTASTIAEEVDYFPFYIHHVVAGLRIEQLPATPENIKYYVARQLVEASDPWQLAHYRTRLATYYPDNDDADNVAAILDVLARINDPADSLSADDILKAAADRGARVENRNDLLRLLRLMDADHYLSRDTEGAYRIRFPLIRRWWKVDRGL